MRAGPFAVLALDYHDTSKHAFGRFAPSRGYLDWATQPDPFRRFAGAPLVPFARGPAVADAGFRRLFEPDRPPAPMSADAVGDLLRCAFGLSAWKQYGSSRWALRVNPSSGNLHPTEAYVVWDTAVWHYAPREHAIERRCVLDAARWRAFSGGRPGLIVALTSVIWREAWKYGLRAFRYCQHDVGHAIGALRYAAALAGWRVAILPRWSDAAAAALTGIDRDADYDGAEREEAECVLAITPGDPEPWRHADPAALATSPGADWTGRANVLSPGRVEWPGIDEVAAATRSGGRPPLGGPIDPLRGGASGEDVIGGAAEPVPGGNREPESGPDPSARTVILQRRSALGFDRRGRLRRDAFVAMLHRLVPPAPPWDAIDWPAHVHLALFVHRVEGLVPGLYVYLRDVAVRPLWQAALRSEFLWEPVADSPAAPATAGRLFLLVPTDVTAAAQRLSCDQDIAADGFFSLAMIARVAPALREYGESFYRRLFWECGLIGQVLYLEAEAVGARATGIGCFYDDPVHDTLGLAGHDWQSLYHFTMGVPVDDGRLTSEPGYGWEA